MGHLISARAFRLGISFEWMDVWFARDVSSYIFVLFTCFRLRYFLLNYLYAKRRDRSNVIYSHIELVRKRRHIFLQVFFYDSQLAETFRSFGTNVADYFRNKLYSYFIVDNNLNNNSLGLLLDADSVGSVKGKGEVWLNNFLYFKNILIKSFNLGNNEIAVFSSYSFNLYSLLFYSRLIAALHNNLAFDLKSKKGIIHKLRKLSVVSGFFPYNFSSNGSKVELPQVFSLNSLADRFKMFFIYSSKNNQSYSYINDWFSFDSVGPTVFNLEYLKVIIEKLLLTGINYKFLNKFNKLMTVNLLNLKKLLDSGFLSSFNDLSSKYRDFIGFIFFKMKRRTWYLKYSLKLLAAVFNAFLINYYGIFAYRIEKPIYNIKNSFKKVPPFSRFQNWKSYYK